MSKQGSCDSLGRKLLERWRGKREQNEIADLLGMDKVTYSRFENGVRRPGGRWAFKIEKVTKGAVPAGTWWRDPPKPRRAA